MKRASSIILAVLFLLSGLAFAQVNGNVSNQVPQILVVSRYVYVTSYDGPEFSPNVLSEDRQAIADVQNAVEKWNHWAVVYNAKNADLIMFVQRRPTEDVIAIYDARMPGSVPLWWASQRGGLDPHEMPLMQKLETLVNQAATKQK